MHVGQKQRINDILWRRDCAILLRDWAGGGGGAGEGVIIFP